MTKFIIQHLRAANDKNGNPRRIWLVRELVGFTIAYDEGFQVSNAMPQEVLDAYNRGETKVMPPMDITTAQYRKTLQQYGSD